jgi:hypothetical protein
MEIIKYENKSYVNGEYVLLNANIYAKGCRSSRDLIKKKNIDNTNYIYARLKENEWIVSDGKSVKLDKVFFSELFIKSIPELNNEKITDKNSVEQAPNIIILEDNQKFKDNKGNIIEIETRGERLVDKTYFKVKDVMKGFSMDRLDEFIKDPRREKGYIEGEHYVYFNCKNTALPKKNKELFLTYEGMLRLLFVSHSSKVKPFIKWATETLFTVHLGSLSQKQVLFSNVLGIDAKVIKEVFNTDRNSLPCVYLFILNTVGKLRETMKIDEKHADNSVVAKYGFTKDLTRRTNEHISKYNKIPNVDLKLKHYSYIDPQYISNAENDIRDYMNAFKTKFDFDKEDEIVIIPTNFMKMIEKQYELIGKSYMGHISELITKIKDLENKLEKQTLQQQIELQNEIHKNELLNKDLQLSEYKIKFLEMQQQNL